MSARHGFRMRSASHAASRHFGPNMTPMVDVVMVILIFFMAGSAVLGPEWLLGLSIDDVAEAVAPDAEESPEQGDPFALDLPTTVVTVSLTVDAQGETRVHGLGVANGGIAELSRRLVALRESGAASTLEILVTPSPDAPYEDVIRAYELVRDARPARVALTRSEE